MRSARTPSNGCGATSAGARGPIRTTRALATADGAGSRAPRDPPSGALDSFSSAAYIGGARARARDDAEACGLRRNGPRGVGKKPEGLNMTRKLAPALAGALLMALATEACDCGAGPIGDIRPDLGFDPEVVDFGGVVLGETKS